MADIYLRPPSPTHDSTVVQSGVGLDILIDDCIDIEEFDACYFRSDDPIKNHLGTLLELFNFRDYIDKIDIYTEKLANAQIGPF